MPEIIADERHAGQVCPVCQVPIKAGMPVHVEEVASAVYHSQCWQWRCDMQTQSQQANPAYAQSPQYTPYADQLSYGFHSNTSGMHYSVPPEIAGKINWGAFLLSPIWSICNETFIGLLWFMFPMIVSIVLLVKGNEWAWQNRRFESVEQFQAVQKQWAKWGIAVWIVLFVLCIISIFIAAALFSDLLPSARNSGFAGTGNAIPNSY